MSIEGTNDDGFSIREFLRRFSTGSERVLDPAFAKQLAELADREEPPNADDLLDALDQAVCFSLTGDFGVVALRTAWKAIGGTEEQAQARRKVRGSYV